MATTSNCGICGQTGETSDHLFRQYHIAMAIWSSLVKTEKLEDFYTRDIKSWMQINIASPGSYAREENDWDLRFGSILWLIWKNRNGRIFDPDYFKHESVLEKSRRLTLEANCAMESSLSTIQLSHHPCIIHDTWQPPPHNWCKISTDGSRNIGSRFASCGVETGLWGIYEVLSHARNLVERLITVEMDSLEVVRMLKHISQNANKVENILAKIVVTRGEVHMFFSNPPLEVIDLVQQEAEDYTYKMEGGLFCLYGNHISRHFADTWRSETHTFHLPCGECMIMLEDASKHLGLPIDRDVLSGVAYGDWNSLFQEYLGGVLPNFNGGWIPLNWLDATFKHLSYDASEEQDRRGSIPCREPIYVDHLTVADGYYKWFNRNEKLFLLSEEVRSGTTAPEPSQQPPSISMYTPQLFHMVPWPYQMHPLPLPYQIATTTVELYDPSLRILWLYVCKSNLGFIYWLLNGFNITTDCRRTDTSVQFSHSSMTDFSQFSQFSMSSGIVSHTPIGSLFYGGATSSSVPHQQNVSAPDDDDDDDYGDDYDGDDNESEELEQVIRRNPHRDRQPPFCVTHSRRRHR
ncbi:hypothetical protein F3Y22_tig00110328pilonHSYRG00636 [Hibiscus syriacus]|uniref:RNase H type-1 domain-containing protein n=1 Tax=Hibiscus syriacus TaxID=106335 RepID=A0A6A3B464_HIBSY|nr:hypothetical protein F3Y22_tig00110328pilonHSYRG00636 [Hibiscus syriacus]